MVSLPIPIQNTTIYEFTKYFLKSAESEFKKLDGKSDTSKYIEGGCRLLGGAVGTAFGNNSDNDGSSGSAIGKGLKAVAGKYDTIKQQRKKLHAMLIISAESSVTFEKTFRDIFIAYGVAAYRMYEGSLKQINVQVSFSPSTDKTEKNESQLLAIQKLAEYAGSKCFDFMIKLRSKENLLTVLQNKKFKSDLSASWEALTLYEFYYWTENHDNKIKDAGPNSERVQQKITAYDFFLKKIPEQDNELARKSVDVTTADTENNEIIFEKKINNFGGENENEDDIMETLTWFIDISQIDSKTLCSMIHDALLHDVTYNGIRAVMTEIEDLFKYIDIHRVELAEIKTDVRQMNETYKIVNEILKKSAEQNQNELAEIKEKLLNVEKRVQSVKHLSTYRTKSFVGTAWTRQKEYGKAVKMFQDVVQVYVNKFGPEHENTLNAKSNLAHVLAQHKLYQESLRLYKQVLEGQVKYLAASDSDLLNTKIEIGTLYFKQGAFEKSGRVALNILTSSFQEDDIFHLEAKQLLNESINKLSDQSRAAFLNVSTNEIEVVLSELYGTTKKMEDTTDSADVQETEGDHQETYENGQSLTLFENHVMDKDELSAIFAEEADLNLETAQFRLQTADWEIEVAMANLYGVN